MMNKVETYRLTHPELLSEETLREIIENSCIALPVSGSLSKDELVEIFKRLALPMPQRRYDSSRSLGRMLSELRIKNGVPEAVLGDNVDPSSGNGLRVDAGAEYAARNVLKAGAKNRAKPSMSDDAQSWKKNRLSDLSCLGMKGNDAKRRSEDSSVSNSKKRQKITWP